MRRIAVAGAVAVLAWAARGAEEAVLRIYDIQELTAPVYDYPGPQVGRCYPALPVFQGDAPPGAYYAVELIEAVKTRVDPASWERDKRFFVQERGGRLIICQTPENHRRIGELFAGLRNEARRQVAVSALVLAVDRQQAAGLRGRRGKSLTAREVEELRRSVGCRNVLASLAVTCLNGQRAHSGRVRQLEYPGGLKEEDGRAEIETRALALGTVLDVRPLLTFDRDAAYVELRLTAARDFRSRRVRLSGTFRPKPPRDAGGKLLPRPEAVPYRGEIELPDYAFWALRTSVTVPLGSHVPAALVPPPEGAGASRSALVLLRADATGPGRAAGPPAWQVGGLVGCTYDVRELTREVPQFPGPILGRVPGGGGYGGSWRAPMPPTVGMGADVLSDLIKRSIEPESWGIGDTSLSEDTGRLTVIHRPAVHRRVKELISGLRPKVKKQVAVDFLLVSGEAGVPRVLEAGELELLANGGVRVAAEGRLCCYNLQRGYAFGGRHLNREVPGPGLPGIDSPAEGTVFDVRPLLGPDGQVATLELRVDAAKCRSARTEDRVATFRGSPSVPLGKYAVVGAVNGGREALTLVLRADLVEGE